MLSAPLYCCLQKFISNAFSSVFFFDIHPFDFENFAGYFFCGYSSNDLIISDIHPKISVFLPVKFFNVGQVFVIFVRIDKIAVFPVDFVNQFYYLLFVIVLRPDYMVLPIHI